MSTMFLSVFISFPCHQVPQERHEADSVGSMAQLSKPSLESYQFYKEKSDQSLPGREAVSLLS